MICLHELVIYSRENTSPPRPPPLSARCQAFLESRIDEFRGLPGQMRARALVRDVIRRGEEDGHHVKLRCLSLGFSLQAWGWRFH